MQQLPEKQVLKRGTNRNLEIDNVTYSDQGEYICVAFNTIGDKRRETQSSPIKLEVSGVPQVLKNVGDFVAVNGHDVQLEAEFCSDPIPLVNTWQWDGIILPSGSEVYDK